MKTIYFQFLLILVCIAGERGLEVRGDGIGPSVPVDLYPSRSGWYSGYHPASPNSLR
jgi:hypothetical protein